MKIRTAMLLPGALACLAHAQTRTIPLDVASLKVNNVKAEQVTWKDRAAVRLSDTGAEDLSDGARYAIVSGTDFQDGVIEADITGDTLPEKSTPLYRGFAGIAFRMAADGKYEAFYLGPKNGRSEDQEQRNHSVQYISIPEFPWRRLRKETPSRYE